MTAYVRSGLELVKRRRVLASAEAGLRAAIQRGAVKPRDVARVRSGHLAYLKALRYELQSGTEIDAARQDRSAAADEAEQAWESATADEIVGAYASPRAIAPGTIPASFAAPRADGSDRP